MVSKEIISEIDHAIKEVWVKDIKKDYIHGVLLYEDSLKCSLYHHLRQRLEKLLSKNNLRIFAEYTFPNLKYRADLVIVKLSNNWKDVFLKDAVTEIVAIFELKYTSGIDRATDEWVKADLRKFKHYLQEGNVDCQFYFGVIYEEECSTLTWIDRRSIAPGKWGAGRVTELDAGLINGTMIFEVNSYNGLNE